MEKQKQPKGKLRRWTGNTVSFMFSPRKIFSVDQHIQNWHWIKDMAKSVLVPKKKMSVQEMKVLAKLPADKESYQAAVAKHGASLEKQQSLHKGYVTQAYIFLLAFFLNAMYAAYDFSMFHLISSLGMGLFFFGMWAKGALLAYQIQNQQLSGVREFFSDLSNLFPDPYFRPALATAKVSRRTK